MTPARARVSIEPMRDDDVPAVAALEPSARLGEEALRAELGRPFAHLWVAREAEGGAVVGYALVWLVVDELHLLNVATRADRRRLGIGRGLVAALVAFARQSGARHVLLEVRRSNAPAIALYRGAGFEEVGVRARYYPDDEDALEMRLGLD
jgi:ribosomal-protein-alanine N-acetyltransferase